MDIFEKLRRLDFLLRNTVWREVCNVATGDAHFPTLAIGALPKNYVTLAWTLSAPPLILKNRKKF